MLFGCAKMLLLKKSIVKAIVIMNTDYIMVCDIHNILQFVIIFTCNKLIVFLILSPKFVRR